MDILNRFLIYKYNDMASLLVRGLELHTKKDYFPLFSDYRFVHSIDPINGLINYFFFTLFDPILAANLLTLFYITLALLFTYLLFNSLSSSKIVSLIFTVIYTFSIYFIYRIISFTPNLYPIFLFPLTIYLVQIKKSKPLFMSLFLFLAFSWSSYYGFFALLLITTLYFGDEIVQNNKGIKKVGSFIKRISILVVPLTFLLASVFYSSFAQNLKPVAIDQNVTYRPIDEYYHLSLRPWYFFIPPKNSLYFGDFSKNIYNKLEKTNYYLANDYTEEEMAGSYMGWHFIAGIATVTCVMVLAKSKKYKTKIETIFPSTISNDNLILKLMISGFLLLLVSQPPSFTVSGITIYTPTYLMYLVAPVFRTLARLAAIFYLLTLLINYFLVLDILNLSAKKIYKSIVLVVLITLTYIFMAVKIPLINMKLPPKEIAFLKTQTPGNLLILPKSDYYSTFWILVHEHNVINPLGYSEALDTLCRNPDSYALDIDVNYIVFYKEKSRDTVCVQTIANKLTKSKSEFTIYEDEKALIKKYE